MIDNKLRILMAMKSIWQKRLTTLFVRQGHCVLDSKRVADQPAADFSIERIGELPDLDITPLITRPANEARATGASHGKRS